MRLNLNIQHKDLGFHSTLMYLETMTTEKIMRFSMFDENHETNHQSNKFNSFLTLVGLFLTVNHLAEHNNAQNPALVYT